MAFWSTPLANKDPKRAFRFQLTITALGLVWYAKTVDRPSYTIESAEHKYLNHTFYYPGHVSWQEVTATLVDPTEPDVAKMVNKIIELSGYGPPVSEGDLTTLGKSSMVGNLGDVIIRMYDSGAPGSGEGEVGATPIETWTLKSAWISGVTHSGLDYSSEDLSTVEVKLKYDWAELKTADDTEIFAGP
jgi:hypothetical protein